MFSVKTWVDEQDRARFNAEFAMTRKCATFQEWTEMYLCYRQVDLKYQTYKGRYEHDLLKAEDKRHICALEIYTAILSTYAQAPLITGDTLLKQIDDYLAQYIVDCAMGDLECAYFDQTLTAHLLLQVFSCLAAFFHPLAFNWATVQTCLDLALRKGIFEKNGLWYRGDPVKGNVLVCRLPVKALKDLKERVQQVYEQF